MMKRTLSVLTAALLATALSAPVFAASKKHTAHHAAKVTHKVTKHEAKKHETKHTAKKHTAKKHTAKKSTKKVASKKK